MTCYAREPLPWNMSKYLEEFNECQAAFDVAYPGERQAAPTLTLCPHWDEFRIAWLNSHPWIPSDSGHSRSDMAAWAPMAPGPGAEQARALVDRLVERRRQLQISQEQLAEKMGTHQPTIARFETGEAGSRELANVLNYAAAVDMVVELTPTEVRRRVGRPRKSRVRK